MALRYRHESPRTIPYAVAVAVVGITAIVVTLAVVIPAFNTGGAYDYWTKLGVDAGSSALDGTDTKLRTLIWLLLPTSGLLALRSPLLVVALPTLGWRFLSAEEYYWGTDWHYSAVLMPVVALALADALARARYSARPWLRSYAHHLPAAVAAAALSLTTTLPMSKLTESDTYSTPAAVTEVERLLDRIPDGATVEAGIGPSSRLTSRCRVFWIGDTDEITPDYIALNNIGNRIPDLPGYVRRLHPRATYSEVGTAHGYVLLEHRT